MTSALATYSSTEAESWLLSYCIAFPEVVPACIQAGITTASFDGRNHGIAFAAVVDLAARRGLSANTIAEELIARGQLDEVGGWPFITAITGNATTTASAAYYVELVASQSKQRRLIKALASASEAAQQPAPTWSEIWDRTEPFIRAAQGATPPASCC